jgi:hypothetical protein
LIIATVIFASLVASVLGGPLVYEWYSSNYTIQEETLLTYAGSIEGNLTVHYNQTIRATITNHADSSLNGIVLVEIVNSIDNSTVFIAQNKSETIPAKTSWQMESQIWRPQSAGTYRIHIKIINPEWSG